MNKRHLVFSFLLPVIILLLSDSALGQGRLKIFRPVEKYELDLGARRQKEIERRDELMGKPALSTNEQQELDSLLRKHEEVVQSPWEVISAECSWYCGGGNYKVRASSALADTNGLNYPASFANDLSYRTAWAEGVPGAGKGEYLEYFFKNKSPRVTHIIISNGFVKNETSWKNNNRVKKLKLYVNGLPFAILQLDDTRDDQVFETGLLGRRPDGKDLVLRFEILEVYKGQKFDDTVLTEIYFDGTDVH